MWLSLVERFVRDEEIGGSNPLTPTTPPMRAELSHLVALLQQDAADADLPEEDLAARDREIGRQISATSPLPCLLFWLHHLAADRIEALRRGLRATGAVLCIIGLVIGVSTAAATFRYTGKHPVNVVHVLSLFVLFQAFLLLLWVLAACRARLPGLEALQDLLAMLNPGRLRRWLSHRLATGYTEALQRAGERSQVHLQRYAELERNVALHAAQILAVAFNIGAIATALVLITTTDLAFAWSTTLNIEADEFHRLTACLALPWGWFWPDAVPSAQLILDSAYYRFQGGELTASASDLGQWWRFLIAAMATYGLLPRLLTLIVSRARLSRDVAATLEAHPGTPLIYSRLTHALVTTHAALPDTDYDAPIADSAAANPAISGPIVVIDWAEVGVGESAVSEALDLPVSRYLKAGGSDMDADEAAIAEIAKGEGPVAIVVKAWEPPMGEFLDFLEDLRDAIAILPLVPEGVASDDQLRIWRQRCGGLATVRGA